MWACPCCSKTWWTRWRPKAGSAQALLVVPVGLLVAYGLLRLSTSLFTELRELVFAKATEGAARRISLEVFGHLHALSLRFHLERQTGWHDARHRARHAGGALADLILALQHRAHADRGHAGADPAGAPSSTRRSPGSPLTALVVYITFTVTVTQWRTRFRREMNELDSKAHTRAVDSLLNYETVKYFNNEGFETQALRRVAGPAASGILEVATFAVAAEHGQQTIIAVGLIAHVVARHRGRGGRGA